MRILLLLTLLILTLQAASYEKHRWSSGEVYLEFLERLNLPSTLYYNIDKEDQTLTEEIRSGIPYELLRDDSGAVLQALIPISDELQFHIYLDESGEYQFKTIPIIYKTREESISLKIESSPYNDIVKKSGSRELAHIFAAAFQNSLNFKSDLRKGDQLVMIYEQKYRLGKRYSSPKLLAAMIEMRNKKHYIYLAEDERYYNEKGVQAESFLLARPIRNARVSSGFSKRRYHPVLKRYRPHLGVDYAAPRGTPILAAGKGVVIFAGRTRGYGKLIKIRHSDGYVTLYAHQKSFRRGIKRGKKVKKGQVIGYVGTTGLSTGPHLHFGLYKNGKAINPARVVKITNKRLKGSSKVAFMKHKKRLDREIKSILDAPEQQRHLLAEINSSCNIQRGRRDETF